MTQAGAREALFIDSGHGSRLFALYRAPHGPVRGALLYIHPFAEEMNRARRMAALAAGEFSARGWAVLQVDLTGCGDSSGDSSDASWSAWLADVDAAVAWLRRRHDEPLVLWGLRAGCLLLSDWLARSGCHHPVLYWQPVSSGRQHMTHFLLMKVAGELAGEQDAKSILQGMRSRLDMGGRVDVAGYTVDAALASGVEQAVLDFPAAYRGAACVLEVTNGERGELTPILAGFVRRWRQAGLQVDAGVVAGPAFWLTQEVTLAPTLIERSCEALEELAG